MSPEIQVIAGILLLSVGASYAWWVMIRVWMLRQDLLFIQGELWDAMHQVGTLDDPDHRELRETLNALIRLAPTLSVLTFLRIFAEGTHLPNEVHQQPASPVVDQFRVQAVNRLKRYLFRETLLGLVLMTSAVGFGLLILTPARVARQRIGELVDPVFRSIELASLGHLAQIKP